MTALATRRPTPHPTGDRGLPLPPTDAEKGLYFGGQHRWFVTARTIAALSTAASLLLFADSQVSLWLFWISLTIFLSQTLLSQYTTTRRRVLTKYSHRLIVQNWAPPRPPSVDVFLPSCGEDLDVLNNTFGAVNALDYDGVVTVYVMDDADRSEVAGLAAEYGFDYLVRPNRPHLKKAGNLKYAFDRSDGDLIVIFDADFAPRPDFITELAPYFGDSAVGIVQSPQFFGTDKSMTWLQRAAGQVQESFYRWAQPSRDALGAPICVGTCAIYRRSALMKSGGFAQIGHSEDVHTGVNLLKVGYRTVYVPIIVAKGLCPEGLAGFISQQYRWCAGSMSLLVDKSFHAAPLTFRQRLCFYTGFGYYISTAAGVFLLSLPTVIMLWVYPQNVHLANFFWMAPTLMLYPFIRVIHKSGWSPAVLRVTMISSFSHALAIWHVLRGRPADWVPTGNAKRTPLATTVMAVAVVWELTFNLLQLAGIVRFLVDGRSPISAAPIIVFSVLNASVWLPVIVLIFQQNFRVPQRSTVVAARPRQPVFVPAQREVSLLEGSDGVVAGRSSWAMLAGAERAAEG